MVELVKFCIDEEVVFAIQPSYEIGLAIGLIDNDSLSADNLPLEGEEIAPLVPHPQIAAVIDNREQIILIQEAHDFLADLITDINLENFVFFSGACDCFVEQMQVL